MEILRNVRNTIKNKFNNELIYSKTHLKAEKIKLQKEAFNFYRHK